MHRCVAYCESLACCPAISTCQLLLLRHKFRDFYRLLVPLYVIFFSLPPAFILPRPVLAAYEKLHNSADCNSCAADTTAAAAALLYQPQCSLCHILCSLHQISAHHTRRVLAEKTPQTTFAHVRMPGNAEVRALCNIACISCASCSREQVSGGYSLPSVLPVEHGAY